MIECRRLDRLELTRKKFARNLQHEEIHDEPEAQVESRNDEEWDGKHCPLCGKDLEVSGRHVSACIMCECGWSKC